MTRKKWLTYAITAFIAAAMSIFLFSFIDIKDESPSGKSHANETGDSNSSGGGVSGVTNNVENDVNGDQANINNSIDNNIENGSNNSIDNNITNNINVNVDVNVQNNVTNNSDGNTSTEENNSNQNNSNEENTNEQNSSNGDQASSGNNGNGEEVVWGVDSASLTTDDLLACVRENFGDPVIWGRYLGEKEGVSAGLTSDEIQLLHNEDIDILIIWNHFTDATGYENGQNEARQAIQEAQQFGIPEGVAIFADIEPTYPVDSEFIRGYYETMSESVYEPGIYGVFDAEQPLSDAYNSASQNHADLQNELIIWTAAPQEGITTEANAPAYSPDAPEGSLVYGWQYGLDAEACNIDTNLFQSELTDFLWS